MRDEATSSVQRKRMVMRNRGDWERKGNARGEEERKCGSERKRVNVWKGYE